MGSGLRVRDPATNRLMFDSDYRTGQLINIIDIGNAASGSFQSALFGLGTPFFVTLSSGIAFRQDYVYPSMGFNGTTFSWSYPNPSNRPAVRVLLGVMCNNANYPPTTGPRLLIKSGDTGVIQFMTGGISYQLAGKGTVYTSKAVPIGNTSPSVVLIPTSSPTGTQLVATSAGFTVARWGNIQQNGQWYAAYSCNTASTGQPVNYWVFEVATNLTGGTVGLKLKDPVTSTLVYNSNYDALRIVDVPELGVDMDNRSAGVSYPAGRTYATIQPSIAGFSQTSEGLYRDGLGVIDDGNYDGSYHNWQRDIDGKLIGTSVNGNTISGGVVSFDDVRAGTPGPAQYPDPASVWWQNPLGSVIVCDVTGL